MFTFRRLGWWFRIRRLLAKKPLLVKPNKAAARGSARQWAKEQARLANELAQAFRRELDLRERVAELTQEINLLSATLKVRDRTVKEYETLVGKLHSFQERETAMQCTLAEAAKFGVGAKHAGNRSIPGTGG